MRTVRLQERTFKWDRHLTVLWYLKDTICFTIILRYSNIFC